MLHVMSAAAKSLGVMGYKAYATSHKAQHFHVGLHDGRTGALLALGNVEPERCVAAFAGDATAQREITDRHLAAGRGGVPALKRILAEDRGRPVPVRVG